MLHISYGFLLPESFCHSEFNVPLCIYVCPWTQLGKKKFLIRTENDIHIWHFCSPQLPFLFGVPLLEQTAAETAHLIVGRTGKHLFLSDRDDGKPPLLVRMVEDCDDGKFMYQLMICRKWYWYLHACFAAMSLAYDLVIMQVSFALF